MGMREADNIMTRELKFTAGKEYENWAGEYKVKELTAHDLIEISGKSEVEYGNLDTSKLLLKSLSKALTKDGGEIAPDLIEKMPGKLYQIVLRLHVKLNMLSQEEATFLSSLL